MDTLLQHGKKLNGAGKGASFNPCFNGYTTSTLEDDGTNWIGFDCVSILVLMDTLLQRL